MSYSDDTLREKRYRSPIKSIFDKFSSHKDVNLIYGDPITHENQTIVPVAKVSYSFGAGGGSEADTKKGRQKAQEQGQGEGGGGHLSVKPLGVYEMTANRARFKPVINVTIIVAVFSMVRLGKALLLRKK